VYSRWIDPSFWPVTRVAVFGGLPPLVRSIAALLVRRQIRRALYLQGMGRHSPAEIYAFGVADIEAVAAQLGERPYVMGYSPSSADATVFAFLAAVDVPSFDTPLRVELHRHPHLVAYVARMRARYFDAGEAAGTGGAAMLHTTP
jgi:glutathione S-transferase